jgi:hypothetical protein
VTILTRGGRNPRVRGFANSASTVGIPTLSRHPTTEERKSFGAASQGKKRFYCSAILRKIDDGKAVPLHRGLFVTATAQSAQNPGRIGAGMP